MLFLGDGVSSMSRRYEEKADGGEDGLDASGAGGSSWAGTGNRGGVGVSASSFGKNSLFFPARAAGGGGGGGADDERGSEWMAGGILAAAATRAVPSGRGDIRPEEEQFCDAFLELQSVLVRGLYSPSRFTLVLVFLCMFVLVGGWVRAIDLS